jgi:hypothetical protein
MSVPTHLFVLIAGEPVTWTSAQVGAWLETVEFGKYAPAFVANAVDGLSLAQGLDDETLDFLGVKLPIHRRKLAALTAAMFK